jgi:5-methylcytosine-specific restriction endonuclease McrA
VTSKPGRTDNAAWRQARALAIKDSGGLCQLCGGELDPDAPKNTPNATEVDHVHPLIYGGSPYDPENLRAVHRWCHQRRDKGQPVVKVPAVWFPCPTCPDRCTHPPGLKVGSRCWGGPPS